MLKIFAVLDLKVMKNPGLLFCLTALLSSASFADSTVGIQSPESFAQDQSTQGQAMIADSPVGPLGLRFSGGLVIDGEDTQQQFGKNDLEQAAAYVGIGVQQQLGNLDLSADLGWMERQGDRCAAPDCQDDRDLKPGSALNSEPVVNLQLRFRF